jgi:hypothetical protein
MARCKKKNLATAGILGQGIAVAANSLAFELASFIHGREPTICGYDFHV